MALEMRAECERCGAGLKPEGAAFVCSYECTKRLKLAGLSLLKESEWLCPGGHELSFNDTARGGLVARSLRAIR